MSQPTPTPSARPLASQDGDRGRDVRQDEQDPPGRDRDARARTPSTASSCERRTVCHAHDEENQSHVGDLVEIMETRPLSKLKRWRIVRIVQPGAQQALAGEGEAAAQVQAES